MLWRRHQPQAQAAGKAKGRQEAHEADRLGGSAAGSLPRHPPSRRLTPSIPRLPALKTSLMSALTGVLYAALVAYLGGWYVGRWSGNFALLLFVLTAVTMLYWLAERFHFAPARRAAAQNLVDNDVKRRETLAAQGIS